MKSCTKCGVYKNINEFNTCKYSKTGITSACKICRKLSTNIWKSKNKERIKDYNKNWRSDNKDQLNKLISKWKKSNLPKINEINRNRALRKTKSCPKWLSMEMRKTIQGFYQLAKELEIQTGVKYHVDHIIPLNGKDVCGLHVPWNLQVIPAIDNLKKSNKN